MICISISSHSACQIVDELKDVSMAEIRMDLINMSNADIKKVFESHPNLVATFRPGSVGDSERTRQLMLALEYGAAWVDIEFEAPEKWKKEMVDFAHKLRKKVIVSSHNFEETPSSKELSSMVESMQREKADLIKLACQVNSKADCARLLSLYEKYKNILVIGMGPIGTITRIAATFLGAPFTFSAGRAGTTAPGQLTYHEMQRAIQLINHGE